MSVRIDLAVWEGNTVDRCSHLLQQLQQMLFAAIVPTHSILTLSTNSKTPLLLTISNAALSPNSSQSSLYLLPDPTKHQTLLVNLNRPGRDSYAFNLTLLLQEGISVDFQAGPGSIHLLGSYRAAEVGTETNPNIIQNMIQMRVGPANPYSQQASPGALRESTPIECPQEDSEKQNAHDEQPDDNDSSEEEEEEEDEDKQNGRKSSKQDAVKDKKKRKRADSEDEEAQPELPHSDSKKKKKEDETADKNFWSKYLAKANNKKKIQDEDDDDDDDDDEDFDEDDEDQDDDSSSEQSEEEVKPTKKKLQNKRKRKPAPKKKPRKQSSEDSEQSEESEDSEPFNYKVPTKLPSFVKQ